MALYAIDGTMSDRDALSNVYYFACRYKCPSIGNARYYSGPGTSAASLGFGVSGAVFGTGAKRLVNLVVETIAEDTKYNPDLPIDLIGFSRGAAIANEVAHVLGTKGILRERTEDSTRTDIPSVRWMGLFDPVHSMGFPIPTFHGPVFLGNRRWCTNRIPNNVKSSTVLIAQDERRDLFRASYLPPRQAARGFFHHQKVLAGTHSDVGGHIENNRVLARIALRKMIEEAVSVGVPVRTTGLITDLEIEQARERKLLNPTVAPGGHSTRSWAR